MNTTESQLDFRRRWVAALRSGTYQQGFGFYHRDGCHCVLGVAECLEPKREESITYLYLVEQTGLGHSEIDDLMQLNDGERMSFPQLADYIEQRWLKDAK